MSGGGPDAALALTDGLGRRIYGPAVDVTGDDFGDLCERHALHLAERFRRSEDARETFVYLDDGKTIKMVAEPRWYPGMGETYELTVFSMGEQG